MTQEIREVWLDEIIAALRHEREREADRWLREAVRLKRGAAGLLDLARRDSPWRPHAWLDWLETIASQQDPACLLRAATEALQNIPEGLESRARAADHLAQAAQALDDRESMLAARWEAFRAEPFPRRLLDLRDTARDRKAQDKWMRQVITQACDEIGGFIPGPLVDGSSGGEEALFLQDGDGFTSGPMDGTIVCALVLAGDGRRAFKVARDDFSSDWLGATTAWTVMLPIMMAWLVGWPEHPTPPHITTLLDEALELFDDPAQPEGHLNRRLRLALAEALAAWKEPAKPTKAAVVNACAPLARAGVNAILESNHYSCVEPAIVMAAATAEMLQAQQSDAAAFKFLDELVATHSRHRHFANLLAVCRRQMRGGSSA